MALSLSEIQEKIQKPERNAQIAKAIRQQNRIKFHVQCAITPEWNAPLTDFLQWVDSLIPADKAKIFKQLFRFPIKTNEVTGIIFDKLSRVFDGRNPVYNYQFISTEERDDWEWYRQEILDSQNVWQTKGWEHFKTEINSILIVDLPEVQTGELPDPYFYWLPIKQVISYKVADNDTGRMEWIIFRIFDEHEKETKIAVYDDAFYRIFPDVQSGKMLGTPLVEVAHDLGYCPARFFWDAPLTLDEPDVKYHPLSKELSELDWFMFYHTSKKHLDLYAGYPIYSGYEQNCDYSNPNSGEHCDGGFLRDKQGNWLYNLVGGCLQACPKCGQKRITGAGSFIEIPVPQEKTDADLRNPVQITTIDRASLDYNVDEEERKRQEIIDAVCGMNTELINDMAVNDKQVTASFENQNTVLNRIKKGFENAQAWVDETICRLRYGHLFLSVNINLGTEFYNLTAQALRKQYADAKAAGASEAELDALNTQILETEYRTNPIQLQRMVILSDLEPYRHFSRAEVLELQSKELIDQIDLIVKLNFAAFVRRFERENTNIIEFGVNIPYERKIKVITEKFIEYANENRQGLAN